MADAPSPAAPDRPGPAEWLRKLAEIWPALVGAAAFRYACYAAMTALAQA